MSATLQRPITHRITNASASAAASAPAAPTATPGARKQRHDEAPGFVRLANPFLVGALRLGVPMGPNLLMTVRGRTSGLPRVAPVAVIELDGRRYIMGAYGATNWVRNLRAAREATLRVHGKDERVTARELIRDDATSFYREDLPRFIQNFPWYGRAFAKVFFGLVGPELANDPGLAAEKHPVFELSPAA
jgi:deazaflavin-dependent oxidoreductase (nitroreductase family)